MPTRGSAIGASGVNLGAYATGIGPAAATGRAQSPTIATVYGQFTGGTAPAPWVLLILVFAEAAALVMLHHGFRHSNGG